MRCSSPVPWNTLVTRLRFLAHTSQSDLAEQLGVDQCTVSRWERGVMEPERCTQKVIRDRLHKLEPAIGPMTVEAMPVLAIVWCMRQPSLCCAASQSFSAAYHREADEMRYVDIGSELSDSIRGWLQALTTTDAFKSRNLALARSVLHRRDGTWARYTGAPIGETNLFLCVGARIDAPADLGSDDFTFDITTNDDLVV